MGAFLACAAFTTLARADREQARTVVVEGAKLLEAQHYAEALAKFEQAYRLYPSPKIHYNLALAYIGLGRSADAFASFERFLRESSDATRTHVEDARQRLGRLADKIGFLRLRTDRAGIPVVIDGRAFGATPLADRVPLDAGPHDIELRPPDSAVQSRRFTVLPRETLELAFATAPTRDTAPSRVAQPSNDDATLTAHAAHPGHSWVRPAVWAAAGVATAALGAGIYFNVRSRGAADDFARAGPMGAPCGKEPAGVTGGSACERLARRHEDSKKYAIVSYAASGALFAAAVALFFIDRESSSGPTRVTITPTGVTYGRSF